MTCGCKKKHKRGSGGTYLSGVTWHKGKGMKMDGGGAFRKRRRRKHKKGGMSISGGGVNFSGSGVQDMTSGALKFVMNKYKNGKRVA